MATVDTTLLERQIGDTVEATANVVFDALDIRGSGAEVRETLRPLYRDVALLSLNAEESVTPPESCCSRGGSGYQG